MHSNVLVIWNIFSIIKAHCLFTAGYWELRIKCKMERKAQKPGYSDGSFSNHAGQTKWIWIFRRSHNPTEPEKISLPFPTRQHSCWDSFLSWSNIVFIYKCFAGSQKHTKKQSSVPEHKTLYPPLVLWWGAR